MSSYQDEELEQVKRWLKQYGIPLLTGALLAAAIYVGWSAWKGHVEEVAAKASDAYQALLEESVQSKPDAQGRSVLIASARNIIDEYPSTPYAHLSALIQAKLQVEAGDLAAAATTLQWSADNGPADGVAQVVTLRLARVYYAQADYEQALALVANDVSAQFTADYQELLGDILLAQGQIGEATQAYEAGLAAASEQGIGRPLLQMKLEDLAVE